MKYLPVVAVLFCAMLVMSGCADINATNQLIADQNEARLAAYADGMAACGNNAACQVGLSAAYFSGAGMAQFIKPDTALDYARGFLPYAQLVLDAWRTFRYAGGHSSGDSSGFLVTGNNNSFFGIGNRQTADNGSSLASTWSTSFFQQPISNSRFFDLTGTGIEANENGATVQ
jgi:hypothetical protein